MWQRDCPPVTCGRLPATGSPGLPVAQALWSREPADRWLYSSLLLLSTVTAAMSSAIPTTIEIHGERVKPEMR